MRFRLPLPLVIRDAWTIASTSNARDAPPAPASKTKRQRGTPCPAARPLVLPSSLTASRSNSPIVFLERHVRFALRRPSGVLHQGTWRHFRTWRRLPDFHLRSYNLTPYKGQTVRIYFTGVEDNGSQTSFVIDDVRIVVE
jgi:hypothetical protein